VGIDHPIPSQDKAIDHILEAPGFSDARSRKMLGGPPRLARRRRCRWKGGWMGFLLRATRVFQMIQCGDRTQDR
jgi:hypothetical protein